MNLTVYTDVLIERLRQVIYSPKFVTRRGRRSVVKEVK